MYFEKDDLLQNLIILPVGGAICKEDVIEGKFNFRFFWFSIEFFY